MYKDESRNDGVIHALERRGANKPCARCGSTHFEVVGQSEIEVAIQKSNPTEVSPGLLLLFLNATSITQKVPVALVACSNCGNLSHHSLGILHKVNAEKPKEGIESLKS